LIFPDSIRGLSTGMTLQRRGELGGQRHKRPEGAFILVGVCRVNNDGLLGFLIGDEICVVVTAAHPFSRARSVVSPSPSGRGRLAYTWGLIGCASCGRLRASTLSVVHSLSLLFCTINLQFLSQCSLRVVWQRYAYQENERVAKTSGVWTAFYATMLGNCHDAIAYLREEFKCVM